RGVRRGGEGGRGRGADQQVGEDATRRGGREGDAEHTEEIEPVLDARERPAQREDERSTEIENEQEVREQGALLQGGPTKRPWGRGAGSSRLAARAASARSRPACS